MKKMIIKDVVALAIAITILTLLMLNLAYGQTSDPQGERQGILSERDGQRPGGEGAKGPGHLPGPPPEAYEACKGKAAGSAAQLTTPWGETIRGACREWGDRLVLIPERPKGMKMAGCPCPPPRCGCDPCSVPPGCPGFFPPPFPPPPGSDIDLIPPPR